MQVARALLQSPFVPRTILLAVILFTTSCTRSPIWYAPPAQRPSLERTSVAMADPDADSYIVQGFRDKSEGPWRWALDHPILRFYLPQVTSINFNMQFTFPEQTFRQTGPVTLTFLMNGHPFDQVRYTTPGEQHYAHPVPVNLLHLDALNTVAIEPDRTASNGSEKLGFVLTRAGFSE